MTEALSAMINLQPFFAVLAFNLLEIHECESVPGGITAIPTAATDGRNLYVNPKFFKKLSVQERVFVLAHEVSHVIFQHPARMRNYADLGYGPDMKPWSAQRFNKAADYVINSYLVDLKVGAQPLGTLLNSQYTFNDLVDDVYCALPEEEDKDEAGGGWDTHLPGDPQDAPGKAEIQRAVAMAAAAQKAQGKLPASMQRMVDEVIEPQIPWEEYLERNILTLYGNEEATWARLNRRRLCVAPHVPWPGRAGNRCGNLALEIDTSGSIGQQEINTFLGVVQGILKSVSPEIVYLMYVDSQLFNNEVIEVTDLDDLHMAAEKAGGGGGTDMTVVFREVEQRELDVEAIIVLTDGCTGFGEDCGIPTIWCITEPEITAPWGTTIHVKI